MQTLSATDAKYGVGRLVNLAQAEPMAVAVAVAVAVAKHARCVVVVLSVEEYERLKSLVESICSPGWLRRLQSSGTARAAPGAA